MAGPRNHLSRRSNRRHHGRPRTAPPMRVRRRPVAPAPATVAALPQPVFAGWLTAAPHAGAVPSAPTGEQRAAPHGGLNARQGTLGHLRGIDGLRAIAVAAVLLYHSELDILPGGFLGVDVFFVISGYLITALLLREFGATRRVDLGRFWFRRARRLLPAVFALLVGVLVFSLVLLPEEVARVRGDVAAALGYVTNWYLIFHQQSYFEFVGRPSPLAHLWSLAVEEQFYLLWPPLLAGTLFLFRRQGALLVTLLLAWLSAIWMAAQFNPDVDPSRIYYGTDTRMFALLIGGALAFIRIPDDAAMTMSRATRRVRATIADSLAVAGLIVMAGLFLAVQAYDPTLYTGGFQLAALAAAMVIGAVIQPGSRAGRILDIAPIRWVGLRSYAIYLWHWPVFGVTRPGLDIPLDGWTALALRLAVTLVLADLSYRFIEVPIRNGAIGRFWAQWTERQVGLGRDPRWSALSGATLVALLVVALGVQVAGAAPPAVPAYLAGADSAIVSAEEASAGGGESGITAAVDPGPDASLDPDDPNTNPYLDVGGEGEGDGTLPPEGTEPLDAVPATASHPDGEEGADGGASGVASAGGFIDPPPDPDPTGAPGTGSGVGSGSTSPTAVPAPTDPPSEPPAAATPDPTPGATAAAIATALPATDPPATAPPATKPPATKEPAATTAPAKVSTAVPPTPIGPRPSGKVLALGDSVMLGAARELHRQLKSVEVNAAVSRSFGAGVQILKTRRAAGTLPNIVVIHLGTNGPISRRQFDQAMVVLKDVKLVVFVNVKVPRPWEAYTNKTLHENVGRYPNTVLVDWRANSLEHSEYFWRDAIHLRPDGAKAYTALILAALGD